MHAAIHRYSAWRAGWTGLALCTWVGSGAAQQPDALQQLPGLHEALCNPQRAATAEQAEVALAKLRAWNLTPNELGPAQRAMLLRIELYAALATGDARAAASKLGELQDVAPEARETFEAAYLVAVATGDADAAQAALKRLADVVSDDERRGVAQRRRWARRIGTAAPDLVVAADEGTKFSMRARGGTVLVVDFWNTHDMTKACAAEVKRLYEEYASDRRVQFLGVNADDRSEVDAARSFAREAGFIWPQHYEGKATRPPITYEAFQAGASPWTVVIDGAGRIRAVGAVTEPAFQYALRAALREAGGVPAPTKPVSSEEKRKQTQPPPVSKEDLPSNDEAESLLREARTFIRTGMKTKAKELLAEIIRKYPGTKQAKDAQERLDLLK